MTYRASTPASPPPSLLASLPPLSVYAVALVLVDALMSQEAQCNLFPRVEGAGEGMHINPLGKKVEGPRA